MEIMAMYIPKRHFVRCWCQLHLQPSAQPVVTVPFILRYMYAALVSQDMPLDDAGHVNEYVAPEKREEETMRKKQLGFTFWS